MVFFHVKKDTESQFLYETSCVTEMKIVYEEITAIYNGRIRIEHLCYGILL
jgi:cilia- and flagella-associated protein 298